MITQPRWRIPEYTKKQINNAGDIIRQNTVWQRDRDEALQVIDNWRASHAYPLHVFYMNLRGKAGAKNDIIVAERLKRLKSIEAKLKREKDMNLYRMQDIGGCRMVLPTIDDVYKYSELFQNSKIRHELKKTNDYIANPKKSGYRSLHLIYRFKTETNGKEIYNEYPMLIELQFRTHLQHIWATALETIGLFTNQALKSGQGNKAILRFFVVISSLFAMQEGCPIVPNTVNDEDTLINEIREIDKKHHVLDMLRAIRTVIEHDTDNIPDKRGYYILQLNYETRMLHREFFKPSELEIANARYDQMEKEKGDAPLDIVLIRASSYRIVKNAYPNYFLDIGEFVDLVKEYLK